MKRKEERLEKEMAEVLQQNKRLTEPLQKATEEVAELQKQLANYNKDKASLAVWTIIVLVTNGSFCTTCNVAVVDVLCIHLLLLLLDCNMLFLQVCKHVTFTGSEKSYCVFVVVFCDAKAQNEHHS